MITLRNAIDEITNTVRETTRTQLGGPFGAFVYKTILSDEGEEYIEVVSTGTNSVTNSNDPTAHAEIVAIRNACKQLGTYDLSGYSLYSTGFPCPMCLGAIIWAGIKNVIYSQTLEDANKLGFKDKEMYDEVFSNPQRDNNYVSICRIPNEKMDAIYNFYQKEGIIY